VFETLSSGPARFGQEGGKSERAIQMSGSKLIYYVGVFIMQFANLDIRWRVLQKKCNSYE